MSRIYRIAIDGPGGAGKSTIAKAVAKRLGIDYIDTGAMYRAVAYKMLENGIKPGDEDKLRAMLDDSEIDFSGGKIFLDGKDVSGLIRTAEVTRMSSECSAVAAVREKLVQLQRNMGKSKSIIMDGRDIGSNVLTDAEYKIFMTATAQERAKRRFEEMQAKGMPAVFEEVLADIEERDYRDTHRELNPLCRAQDAKELDTTNMTIDEVIEYIISEVRKNGDC
ncbi:MAG: (d)CMP kinase [Clostridia bacterium]|nr:(d)CMP kinase [Clostridia bacterium]